MEVLFTTLVVAIIAWSTAAICLVATSKGWNAALIPVRRRTSEQAGKIQRNSSLANGNHISGMTLASTPRRANARVRQLN